MRGRLQDTANEMQYILNHKKFSMLEIAIVSGNLVT